MILQSTENAECDGTDMSMRKTGNSWSGTEAPPSGQLAVSSMDRCSKLYWPVGGAALAKLQFERSSAPATLQASQEDARKGWQSFMGRAACLMR
jgi:hypothetical protein